MTESITVGFAYLKRLFQSLKEPQVTLEYPFAARRTVQKAHTQLRNDFRECIGCLDCQRLCPVGALQIRGLEFSGEDGRPSASNGMMFQMRIQMFEINYGACTLCGICVAECPTSSLGFDTTPLEPESDLVNLRIDLARQKKNKLVIKGQNPWKDI